jgi:hypothetical protein
MGKWSLVSSSLDVGREYGEVWANGVRLSKLISFFNIYTADELD